MLEIHNSLGGKKAPFKSLRPNEVRMYVCGPTVYSKAHVGHAMSALVFDVIRRYLEYSGLNVTHMMNFTDVDDKIIMRAKQEGVDPFALAEGYIIEFKQNLEDLNILPATRMEMESAAISRPWPTGLSARRLHRRICADA